MKETKHSDLKVRVLQMPRYHEHLDENLDLVFFNVKKYCQSQNINMHDTSYFNYAMLLITVNLRGSAAAWHQDFAQQGKEVHYIEELKEGMTREFVLVDMQERLREKRDALKPKHCRNREEYIMKFRKLMSDIKDMSDLDRVMCFTRGLVLRTKQEVLYRRFRTTTEAMTVALEFERSHALKPGHRLAECRSRKYNNHQNKKPVQVSNTAMKSGSENEEEDMIDTIVIGNVTAEEKYNELIRKKRSLGDARVKILIDSGANHNIIRPILGTYMFQKKKIQAVRFDGLTTTKKITNVFKKDIMMEGQVFKDITLTEWELPHQQDIILGKPWLVQYNHKIDWRTRMPYSKRNVVESSSKSNTFVSTT
ncbi:hypothetical protein PsorP6_017722 [Peronosclerospora sorghi]|uniref:Uncharacterized protein n=1 Tax=Peronosclerospora sorghi TaxID=230839 RepID=A0ACC0WPG4_9STRA|nr:hypothetical protein PsorP6_017722 [Peronosclerospora sorghi]